MLHIENVATAAVVAVLSRTRAVGSFSRLSPSRIASTRLDTGIFRMIDTATASVGLMTAPSATAQA